MVGSAVAETCATVPRLDGYRIHSATLHSVVLQDAEVLSALHDLSDTGVAVGR